MALIISMFYGTGRHGNKVNKVTHRIRTAVANLPAQAGRGIDDADVNFHGAASDNHD